MKIDRRGFLSLGIGAAAGTALSPIPWKLADDSAIWTQMWPWTPVPVDGEVSFEDSTCTLCPGGCGITVRKVDDRAVKIEGRKGHPINDGGLCLLGLSGLQLLYNPTRVRTPLKRAGDRGENKWQRISWTEALSLAATKLGGIRKSDQAHMVGAVSDSEFGTIPQFLKRFLTAYGSPNFMTTPSIEDSYRQALHLMQGGEALAGFDLENSDHILSFGSGLLDGWGSPVRMFMANSGWRNTGATVVQVEPRMSRTAAKSDRWIPINPGTDTALAMGIAYVIIKGSHYDKEFIDQHSTGFEDWVDDQGQNHRGFKQQVLEDYALESVERTTGIKRADIITIAEGFAGASRPLAICGSGQGNTPGSLNTFLAVQALNALVGNINQKGGVWSVPKPDDMVWPEVDIDGTAKAGNQYPRLDEAGGEAYPFSQSLLNRFFDTVAAGSGYPMQALMIASANPCYAMPDVATVKKAFAKIPFILSFSSYMDETAQNADLILPNHTYLERWEDVPVTAGIQKPMMGLAKPVVRPIYNTRHTGDVILDIAGKIGGNVAAAFPWRNYEACLKKTFRSQWRSLSRKGVAGEVGYQPPALESAFDTPSKKFEFSASALRSVSGEGVKALPHFVPVKVGGDDAYPLMLIPYDDMRLAGGYIADPPFAVKTVSDGALKGNDGFVEINPGTAAALRLRDGKLAQLSTPKGTASVRVRLSEGIMPGVIALPRGLGHTAYDKFIAGKGVNVNELIEPVEDPITGLDAAWGIRAKLSKA